jgi:hypothetical protein
MNHINTLFNTGRIAATSLLVFGLAGASALTTFRQPLSGHPLAYRIPG